MKKGFTLIELLAVILILGIIALIAIPAVNNVIEDARLGAERTTINHIIKAYEDYYQIQTLKGTDPSTLYLDCLAKDENDQYLYTMKEITENVGINGDIHELTDYYSFKLDANGNALIEYDFGNYTCSNFTEDASTHKITVLAKGDCEAKKTRN